MENKNTAAEEKNSGQGALSGAAVVILGAGKGTRMKSDLPKVMMPVHGKPMIRHIIDTLEQAGIGKIVTIISPDGDLVKKETAPHVTAVQAQQLGTGDAVKYAEEALRGFAGPVFVVFGDTPLITAKTFAKTADKNWKGLLSIKTRRKKSGESDFAIPAVWGLTGGIYLRFWRVSIMKMRQKNTILPMRCKLRGKWA